MRDCVYLTYERDCVHELSSSQPFWRYSYHTVQVNNNNKSNTNETIQRKRKEKISTSYPIAQRTADILFSA